LQAGFITDPLPDLVGPETVFQNELSPSLCYLSVVQRNTIHWWYSFSVNHWNSRRLRGNLYDESWNNYCTIFLICIGKTSCLSSSGRIILLFVSFCFMCEILSTCHISLNLSYIYKSSVTGSFLIRDSSVVGMVWSLHEILSGTKCDDSSS
jgi:hypothetical protein